MTWSFERGFIDYVETRTQERIDGFIDRLETFYVCEGSKRQLWVELMFAKPFTTVTTRRPGSSG